MIDVAATVFTAENIFLKEAEIENMTAVRIIEDRLGFSKFSIWAEATPGNLTSVVKQSSNEVPRVVSIKLKDTSIESDASHAKRNYIKGQASIFSLSGTLMSGVSDAWVPSSDSILQLSGKYVTFSVKASVASAVTGTRCKVKLVYKHLPDGSTLTDGEMVIDILSTVTTTAKRFSVTARMPDIGLQQIGVAFDVAGLTSAVTFSEVKLELGKVMTTWELAPEDSGAARASDTYAGIIDRVALEEKEDFKGLVIEGYLMERILDYRCIWGLFTYSGALKDCIYDVIDTQIINPALTGRAIPDVEQEIPDALSFIPVDSQKTGGSVSDFLYGMITDTRYVVSAVHDYMKGKIRLFVYEGKDRTLSQSVRPPVVFTRKNGLLLDPQYEKISYDHKNTALVAGAGEGTERAYQSVGTTTGWARREVFIDARDLQKKDDDGNLILDADYLAQLAQRGKEKLAGYSVVENFKSDVNTSPEGYVYNRDYFLGDVVTLFDELYGMRLDAPLESIETNITQGRVTRKLQFGTGQLTLNQKLKLRLN